jgi:hypothetical protein
MILLDAGPTPVGCELNLPRGNNHLEVSNLELQRQFFLSALIFLSIANKRSFASNGHGRLVFIC